MLYKKDNGNDNSLRRIIMFRFEDLTLTKEKKKELKDIKLNEISVVDSPANQIPFLIVKAKAGEQLNPLEQLLALEEFEGVEVKKVDGCLKQLDFLDDETADAVGILVMAAASCEGLAVGETVGTFFSKAEMEDDEREVIDNALQVVSDLDGASLTAIRSLLKLAAGGAITAAKWPSISASQSATQDQSAAQDEPAQSSVQNAPSANVNKGGLKWASISGRVTTKSQPTKKTGAKWPTLVGA